MTTQQSQLSVQRKKLFQKKNYQFKTSRVNQKVDQSHRFSRPTSGLSSNLLTRPTSGLQSQAINSERETTTTLTRFAEAK